MGVTPSPEDAEKALKAVRDIEPSMAPMPHPHRSIFQHPATKVGGWVGMAATVVGLLVPVWEPWLAGKARLSIMRDTIAELEADASECKLKLKTLQAQNKALRKKPR